MKKVLCSILLVAMCFALLAGCACEHEFEDADCVTPKTCSLCGQTEGEALGHSWKDATCTTPKTCAVCGETEGEALGHSWKDATCAAPRTCSLCGQTEGEALEHSWLHATTEAPKTCAGCGATEGERIITDPRFTTDACSMLFGTWKSEVTVSACEAGISDSDEPVSYTIEMTFRNDGTVTQTNRYHDPDKVGQLLLDYLMETMYLEMETMGIGRADADAAFESTYGMDIPTYCEVYVQSMNLSEAEPMELVYYVADGKLYVALDWDFDAEEVEMVLDGETLTLTYSYGEVEVYTRVNEE